MDKQKVLTLGKVIFPLILFIFSLTGALSPLLNRGFKGSDGKTEAYLDKITVNATSSYALARGINGIVSVIQESEVNAVVGTIAAGEILDPVNDIIEKLSGVLLLALTSIGFQQFLFKVSQSTGAFYLVTSGFFFFTLYSVICYFLSENKVYFLKKIGSFLLTCFIFIRFFIPFSASVGLGCQSFLEGSYEKNYREIASISDSVSKEYETLEEKSEKKSFFSNPVSSIKEKAVKIGDSLKALPALVTNLITIFVIQTILLPLLLLWVFKSFLRLFFNA